MTTHALDTQAAHLLAHLHRGGEHAYWWAVKGAKKTSIWWEPGRPKPMPNNQHNVYFGVHPCTAIPQNNARGEKTPPAGVRSQVAYIAAINCLFAEFDAKHFEGGKAAALAHIEALDPSPSAVVDSGGGFHCYWLLADPFLLGTDEDRARADRAQKGWVKRVGSDDGAKDLARVLRVPGTQNFKPEYGPDFPAVRFVWADFGLLYTLGDLEALLPAEAPVSTLKRPHRRDVDHQTAPATATGTDHDFDTIADAARNLGHLAAWRCDEYSTWIDVGMALRELGAIGFEFWRKWSKLSPKYNPGDCEEHWPTFKPGADCNGLTLASLKAWAKHDDPERAPAVPEEIQQQLAEYKQEESIRLKILTSPMLEDREKVAWLAMRNTLDLRTKLRPDGSVRLSGKDVGCVMGRSASTGNRATHKLEEHSVLICDPQQVALEDGTEVEWMYVQPGPAWNDFSQLTPATSTKKRGGARPGAGRKAKCASCPPETRIIKRTEVKYVCEGCGEVLATEPPKHVALAPDAEINFDYGSDSPENGAQEAGAEIKVDCAPAAPGCDADSEGAEIKIDYEKDRGNSSCNSAMSPTTIPTGNRNDVIIGPTRIGDALVNLGYIQNRLRADDRAAIETHCLLAGIDPGVAIEAAQRAAPGAAP